MELAIKARTGRRNAIEELAEIRAKGHQRGDREMPMFQSKRPHALRQKVDNVIDFKEQLSERRLPPFLLVAS